MEETSTELGQIQPEIHDGEDTVGEERLHNFREFREKAKALSHIKVQRKRSTGNYFHHFIIISITNVSDDLVAVTVGEYTSSGEIFTERDQGIGQFVSERIFLGNDKHHEIFDFEKGVYLVKSKQYPKTEDEIKDAFIRFDEMIDERRYELSSNNCGHSITYILTGESRDEQADPATGCSSCFIDFCDIVIMDCKDVGFRTALLVAGLGAIAGALVRRAYVRVIIAAIVSNAVGDEIVNCENVFGANLRNEAHRRIAIAEDLQDINIVIANNSIKIVDNLKDHLQTQYVCGIAEKLIKEAALMTGGATLFVAIGLETVFFLFYVCFNLVSRRRRNALKNKKLCRVLFLCLFGGYGSIAVAVLSGYFAFLTIQRPALAFFGFVTVVCLLSRYVLTVIAGQIFNLCCCSPCWKCCSASCCRGCGLCCNFVCCCHCRVSTISFLVLLVLIVAGIICSLVLYFLK